VTWVTFYEVVKIGGKRVFVAAFNRKCSIMKEEDLGDASYQIHLQTTIKSLKFVNYDLKRV
jgi:hypothetical protein